MQSVIWKAKTVPVLVCISISCQLVNKYGVSEVGLPKHLVQKEIQQITFSVCEPDAEVIFLCRHYFLPSAVYTSVIY